MSDDSRREGARGPALDSPQPADSPPSSPSPHDPTVEMEGSSSAIAGPSGASGLSSTSDDLDSPPAGPLLLEGEVLAGRYCVRQFLARGGGGEVYEAEDLELGGRVALKILASGPAGDSGSRSERFRREIQLARRVTHPNVCRLYEFGRHTRRGTPDAPGAREFLFITMELLRGPTLAQHLLDNGPLTPTRRCRSSASWRPRSTPRIRPASCTAISRAPTSSSCRTTRPTQRLPRPPPLRRPARWSPISASPAPT